MPGGDRTGPDGYGPMSGRGAGFCAGYPASRFMDPAWGRGRGRGFGRGGGGGGWRHRHWYRATGLPNWHRGWAADPYYTVPLAAPFAPMMAKDEELEVLKNQAKYFEQALENLRGRIREIDSVAESSETT
jgi:hypothetical protein